MANMDIEEIVNLINGLMIKANESGALVYSGYPTDIYEIDNDLLSFVQAVASELNANVVDIDEEHILMKRNNIYTDITWSIGSRGDIEMTIEVYF
jgi:ornithine carbamoyltransferase